MQSSLRTYLSELIRFKTLTQDHAINLHALHWILKQVQDLPPHAKILHVNGFPSLIMTTRNTMTPRLWLQAHIDVVPASEEMFEARFDGNRFVGRGAFDMKFAIACYLQLVQELGKQVSQYDFGMMITSDEETGGQHGVKALLDQGYRSEATFLPDGGKDWQFVSASRGIWHLRATCKGESQHGARPWLGKNAIVKLMRFTEELLEFFPKEPCNIENHFHNSMNVSTVSGGTAMNQIPDLAEAQYDIRYVVEDYQKLNAWMDAVLKKYPEIRIETLATGKGYQVDRQNPYFLVYQQCLTKHGVTPSFEITHGSSDARYFAEYDIPVIVLRPVGGGHHSADEWIDLGELEKFYQVLRDFVQETTLLKSI